MKKILSALMFVAAFIFMSCEKEPEPVITGISLDKANFSLEVGKVGFLWATVTPDQTSKKALVWSSSLSDVAAVSQDGVVAAVSCGNAVITVGNVDGTINASCTVTVIDRVAASGITLNRKELLLDIYGENNSARLLPTVTPHNATDKIVQWESTDQEVVVVDIEGKVTAKSTGTATITVTSVESGEFATCKVKVVNLLIDVVSIPLGVFLMGSPVDEPMREENEVQHSVTIEENFKIGKYEITNAQFCAFLNANGVDASGLFETTYGNDGKQYLVYDSSAHVQDRVKYDFGVNWDYISEKWKPVWGMEDFPVIHVTGYGAMEFAHWLGGSLPTDRQWEYACRGGMEGKPFGLGDGSKLTYSMANFNWKYPYDSGIYADLEHLPSKGTQKIGTYAPNDYGLYDMHGNVSEWVINNVYFSLRGGSWIDEAGHCRSARVDNVVSSNMKRYRFEGFRIILP